MNVWHVLASTPAEALELQALPPKPFPKLPVKLLEDVSPDGPLHLIATHCHSIVKQRNTKRVDFANPGRRKEVRPCCRSPQEGTQALAAGCGTYLGVLQARRATQQY